MLRRFPAISHEIYPYYCNDRLVLDFYPTVIVLKIRTVIGRKIGPNSIESINGHIFPEFSGNGLVSHIVSDEVVVSPCQALQKTDAGSIVTP